MISWNARNQLISISGNVTASFSYDALGRRVSKTINGTRTDYQYDGQDIVAEIGGGAVGATYIRSLNIDEPFARITSNGQEYYHTDALGSVFALTNASGVTTASYIYDPFGNTTQTGVSSNIYGIMSLIFFLVGVWLLIGAGLNFLARGSANNSIHFENGSEAVIISIFLGLAYYGLEKKKEWVVDLLVFFNAYRLVFSFWSSTSSIDFFVRSLNFCFTLFQIWFFTHPETSRYFKVRSRTLY